jgi:hypothetical protein
MSPFSTLSSNSRWDVVRATMSNRVGARNVATVRTSPLIAVIRDLLQKCPQGLYLRAPIRRQSYDH